jgi:hypothetical protein
MSTLGIKPNFFYPFHHTQIGPVRGAVANVQDSTAPVVLKSKGLWLLKGDHRWRVIICLEGELWITQSRDLRDYVLTAGDLFIITQPGTVVVQARSDSRIQMAPALTTAPCVADFAKTVFP